MTVKLLTEQHLEFLSLKGGCRGSSESTHVKMSNCWKSHAAAQYCICRAYSKRKLYMKSETVHYQQTDQFNRLFDLFKNHDKLGLPSN